jgi:hypothetical protein
MERAVAVVVSRSLFFPAPDHAIRRPQAMTRNDGKQSNFISIMSRRLVSKDATTLPRHHQEEKSASSASIKNKKSLNETKFHKNKTPSFGTLSARSVTIFFRQCFRDSSFSVIVFLFLCTSLLLITANDSSPILRRLTSAKSHYSFDKPRIIQVNTNLDHLETKQYLETYEPGLSTQEIYISESAEEAQKLLKNSKKYGQWSRDPLKEGDCEPMHWWQETSFPSCNKMHEMHMEKQFQFLADGGYNSVFSLRDIDRSMHVVKILQYETDHTDRNFDRVRRDSLIMERSTRSPYVVDIHSFCGFAQVVEFGKDGNLDDVVWNHYEDLSSSQKLQIATQVAQALADVHNMDGDGRSSMSHGDFATKQYILINGHLKLNDFNRGRFIRWNPKKKESCPYTIGSNDGKVRSDQAAIHIPAISFFLDDYSHFLSVSVSRIVPVPGSRRIQLYPRNCCH